MLFTPICSQADVYHFADVNHDGEVNISDINMVIDVILGHDVQPPQPTSETFMVNGVAFSMVKVEGGIFSMGAANDDNDVDEFAQSSATHVRHSQFCTQCGVQLTVFGVR